tara:strand:+ start:1740 stop:2738 length:999 start_codon:yes stop_codon:yes gene_type:complete
MSTFEYKYTTNKNGFYYCNICNYVCCKKSLYNQHINTEKHKNHIVLNENMKNMNNNKNNEYICKKCDYKCCKKFLFQQHLKSKKHINYFKNVQKDKLIKNEEVPTKYYDCICGKKYKYKSGLYNHKKKCKNINNEIKQLKDMFMELLKKSHEHNEIQNELMNIITNNSTIINNIENLNQTTFNLNFFLNEECKNALNIDEFINQLKIGLDDLEYTKNNGINKGILNIFTNGLKEVGTYKQPIHCTDKKRETIYIKDNDKWDKDHNKEKLEQSFKNIQSIQIQNIQNWQNENEGWQDSTEKKDEYIQLVTNVMTTLNKDKMIKEISKEVLIKK